MPPVSQPGPSSSPQTRWSAAGAHLGGRLAIDAKMISETIFPTEQTQEQRYAETSIEIFYLLAQLKELLKDPAKNKAKIDEIYKKFDELSKGPDIFDKDITFFHEGKEHSFNMKNIINIVFANRNNWIANPDLFNDAWSKGAPPLMLCALALVEYKGSGMDMSLSNTDPHATEKFVRMCLIMAAIDTTKGGSGTDSSFWGWASSFGNFADVFPDMLMVYLYDKYIKNDTPEEWAKFQKEFSDIVNMLPKPDASTPSYEKAYKELQNWMKDSDSWESWDDLPVGYPRDFITGDVGYPLWNEWRRK